MSEIQIQFQDLLRDLFADDELRIGRETTAQGIEGWDSLMHINILIAVEQRFGIHFATAEIAALKDDSQNVGTFLDLIESKRNALE